jgi:transcription antitermination factor NusG
VSDPKLWQVRVKKGMERIAAMALMNKVIDFATKGKPLTILSATYAENIENFIFVEAYKIESVKEAIEGLHFCYFKIEMVNLNEMTKLYEDQDQNLSMPEEGQWVRIKEGLYQDDLGQVERIVDKNKIYVKLIPRMNIGSGRGANAGFLRPQQQAFNKQNFP